MAGGYGIRDGSSITRAIENYNSYKERQGVRAENQRRYDQNRQDTLAQRKEVNDHRQWQRDSHDEAIERAENEKLAEAERRRTMATSILGRGASGEGVDIDLSEDPNNPDVLGVSVVTKEGEKRPATVDPKDNNSTQMKIPKADAAEIEAHVTHHVNGVLEKGGTEEDAEVVGRAALYTDPETGITSKATPEQFEENTKKQGFMQKYGKYFDPKQGKENGLIGKGGTLDMAAGAVVEFVKTGAKSGQGLLDVIKSNISDPATDFLFGEKSPVNVTNAGTIAAKPSQVNLEDSEHLAVLDKVKSVIDTAKTEGQEVPPPPSKVQTTMEQTTLEGKNVVLKSQFRATKQQQAAAADLYVHGDITINQLQNFAATGDFSLSAEQQQKHFADLGFNASRQKKTNLAIEKTQLEIAKIRGGKTPAELAAEENEKMDKVFKNLGDVFDDVAVSVNGGKKYSDQLKAELRMATRNTVTAVGIRPEKLASLGGVTFIQNALVSYGHSLKDGEMDFRSSSFTSHFNTAVGKLRGTASEGILKVAKGAGIPVEVATKRFNDLMQIANSDEVDENGMVIRKGKERGDNEKIVEGILDYMNDEFLSAGETAP